MSGGRQSLKELGINVDKYYASEINESSIKVAQYNHPDIIQLGNILEWKTWNIDWLSIDVLIGGSPCEGFSIAGKKLNFEDKRSKLFFTYVDILNYLKSINPKIKFLLENVKMKDEYADKIDELLNVKRAYLNSRNFTGMIRKRYYWTNLIINTYEEKDIKIKNLIDDFPFNKDIEFFLSRTIYSPTISSDGIITINPKDKNGKQTWQRGRVYDINGNCPTICATLFDLNITENHKTYRKLTISECEKLMGFTKGYTKIVSKNEAGKMLGSGWDIGVIKHILKGLKCV